MPFLVTSNLPAPPVGHSARAKASAPVPPCRRPGARSQGYRGQVIPGSPSARPPRLTAAPRSVVARQEAAAVEARPTAAPTLRSSCCSRTSAELEEQEARSRRAGLYPTPSTSGRTASRFLYILNLEPLGIMTVLLRRQ